MTIHDVEEEKNNEACVEKKIKKIAKESVKDTSE
jgi:hypothetical protein